MNRIALTIAFFVSILVVTAGAHAQIPPEGEQPFGPPSGFPMGPGGSGGPPGGFPMGPGGFPRGAFGGGPGGFPMGPGGPGGDRGFRFDPRDMLRRLDANQNGVLEAGEYDDRSGWFVRRAAERAGMDPNQPLKLDELFRRSDERRRDEEGEPNQQPQSKERKTLVPGFGIADELPKVPGFNIPLDSPLLSSKPLEQRYDGRVLERVNQTLQQYDRNRDDVIDQEEMKAARWTDNPLDSDIDGDGRLSKVELAERYARRYGNQLAVRTVSPSSSGGGFSPPPSSGSSSSSSTSSPAPPSSVSDNEKVRRYAESMLKQFDDNKNGVLDKEEWGKVRNPERYNSNEDNVITLDELIAGTRSFSRSESGRFGNRGGSGGGSSGNVYRFKSTSERLAALGVPSSFSRNDQDADGQIQMAEFSSSWSDVKIAEFQKYDENGDWVITPQEWLTAEKGKKLSEKDKPADK